MAISDAEYLAWLAADGKQRCILAEMEYYSGGVGTLYASNLAYISHAGDSPEHTPYDDVITSIPSFTTKLSLPDASKGDMKIKTETSWGDLQTYNTGEYDHWRNYAFAGRTVRLYRGDPAWPKSDFRQILSGICVGMETTQDGFVFKLRGKEDTLNVEIQANELTAGDDSGHKKPLCFGQVFNIEPVSVDTATHTYQIHDGAIQEITDVRDNGITVLFTPDLVNGKFSLSAMPAGKITVDCKGAKFSGTYYNKASDLVKNIAITYAGWNAGEIDAASFSANLTDCPQTVGVYVRDGGNVLDVFDDLLSSVGSYWYLKRNGYLAIRRFTEPAVSATVEIAQDDVLFRTFKVLSDSEPVWRVTYGYQRNYATQDADSIAGAVFGGLDLITAQQRNVYAQEYKAVSNSDAAVKTTYPLAADPAMLESCLYLQADASAEAQRVRQAWDSVRSSYSAECVLTPGVLELGDTIRFTHPRYGFSGGLLCVVVGIEENPTKNRIVVDFWR